MPQSKAARTAAVRAASAERHGSGRGSSGDQRRLARMRKGDRASGSKPRNDTPSEAARTAAIRAASAERHGPVRGGSSGRPAPARTHAQETVRRASRRGPGDNARRGHPSRRRPLVPDAPLKRKSLHSDLALRPRSPHSSGTATGLLVAHWRPTLAYFGLRRHLVVESALRVLGPFPKMLSLGW